MARRRLADDPPSTRDYPLIVATVLITSVLAVLVQLVDLCYPLLDPRVRLGKAAA